MCENMEIKTSKGFEAIAHGRNQPTQAQLNFAFRISVQGRRDAAKAWISQRRLEIETHCSDKNDKKSSSHPLKETNFTDQHSQQLGYRKIPAVSLSCMKDSFFSSASTSSHSSIENIEFTTVESFDAIEKVSTTQHFTDQQILQAAFCESVQRRKQTEKAWFSVRSKEIENFHTQQRQSQAALPGVVSYD